MEHRDARIVLAERIEKEGISLAQAAARLGVSRTYLSLVVRGLRPISLKLAHRIKPHWPDVFMAFWASQVADAPPQREQVAV